MTRRRISLLFCCALCLGARAQDAADSTADSAAADTADLAETQEDEFQAGVGPQFNVQDFGVDTFAWDNGKINSGRFDSGKWGDTARIALVDSAQKRIYVHPYDSFVTSNFGQRRWFWHFGVDVKARKGDTIPAALDGVVRVTQYDRRGYGNVVVVRHPNGLETIYGHLSKILAVPNQKVRAGEAVGLAGNTGHSTGSHLHFEWRYFGEPFDPNCIVDFENYRLRQDTLVLTRANFEYLAELRKTQWHTIHRGETLGHIARRYHTTVRGLCSYNHITPRTILRIGRKIIVGRDRSHEPPVLPVDTLRRSEESIGGGNVTEDPPSGDSSVLTAPVRTNGEKR
jgi:murein DD-endopeptidase MepM/ murein hydrolase activator NlpD